MSPAPTNPKIYHIVHYDRLASIIKDEFLFSDKISQDRNLPGTNIGMSRITETRLRKLLSSHPSLHVGECIPFYFCPRSIMLYLIYRGNNQDLDYKGGQDNIVHLEAKLHDAIQWADEESLKWAFTLANAATSYFEDRADISKLEEINWEAVNATKWSGQGIDIKIKDGKQSEFLVENRFPWKLISSIGVENLKTASIVRQILGAASGGPPVLVQSSWYY